MIPPDDIANVWRAANVVLALVGFVTMVALIRQRFRPWTVSQRLAAMSLTMFCFAALYSTVEVLFLPTFLRVPLVTIALLWCIATAVLSARYYKEP